MDDRDKDNGIKQLIYHLVFDQARVALLPTSTSKLEPSSQHIRLDSTSETVVRIKNGRERIYASLRPSVIGSRR